MDIPKQDRVFTRTADKLEQKYNFDEEFQKLNREFASQSEIQQMIDQLSQAMTEAISQQNEKIAELEANSKEFTIVWQYNSIPTLSNLPALAWNTEDKKMEHLGDLYLNKLNGNLYVFSYSGFSWEWVLVKTNDKYIVTFYDDEDAIISTTFVDEGDYVNPPIADKEWQIDGETVVFPYLPSESVKIYMLGETNNGN